MATSKRTKIVVGGVYASRGDDGFWRITKVLAIDRSTVQIRLYTNKYQKRPKAVDPDTLTLTMTIEDLERGVLVLGVGCMPISRRAFIREARHFLRQDPVTQEELQDI